jgi:hypothetical protein
MSFMFQGICAEAGVLHKKKREEKREEKRKKNHCESLNRHNIFFFDTDSNQPKQFFRSEKHVQMMRISILVFLSMTDIFCK